jgi:hypothetical protein
LRVFNTINIRRKWIFKKCRNRVGSDETDHVSVKMTEMMNLNSRVNWDSLFRFFMMMLVSMVLVSMMVSMVLVSVVLVSVVLVSVVLVSMVMVFMVMVLMFSSVSLGVILHTLLRFFVVTHFIVNKNNKI